MREIEIVNPRSDGTTVSAIVRVPSDDGESAVEFNVSTSATKTVAKSTEELKADLIAEYQRQVDAMSVRATELAGLAGKSSL